MYNFSKLSCEIHTAYLEGKASFCDGMSYTIGLQGGVEQLVEVLKVLHCWPWVVRVTQEHTAEQTTGNAARSEILRRQLAHLDTRTHTHAMPRHVQQIINNTNIYSIRQQRENYTQTHL